MMGIVPFLIATLLILSGISMFMVNMGFGSWWMLRRALDYWPVIFIILGLSMLGGGGKMPRWLAYVLILALVAAVIFFFFYQSHLGSPLIPPMGGST